MWQRYLNAATPQTTRGALHSLADLGEAAARANAPISWDRRGDLLWWDRCEAHPSTRWTLSGAGAALSWSRVFAFSGSRSYELTTPGATTPAAQLAARLPAYQPAAGLGLELAFAIDANLGSLDIFLLYYSGAVKRSFGVSYSPALDNLRYYRAAAGTWYEAQALSYDLGVTAAGGPALWHRLKLAVIPSLGNYLYCALDGVEYDWSSLAAVSAADTSTLPMYEIQVKAYAAASTAAAVGLDDVLVTTNEA